MKFSRRLMLFGFGVLLGTLLSAFFFSGRTNVLTGWLPNARILARLNETKLLLKDKSVKCKFDCLHINSKDLACILTDGDVLFSESKTNQEPKLYVVYAAPKDSEPFKIIFSAEDTTSTIVDVSLALEDRVCNCK